MEGDHSGHVGVDCAGGGGGGGGAGGGAGKGNTSGVTVSRRTVVLERVKD